MVSSDFLQEAVGEYATEPPRGFWRLIPRSIDEIHQLDELEVVLSEYDSESTVRYLHSPQHAEQLTFGFGFVEDVVVDCVASISAMVLDDIWSP